jgi:hypothetical protein
MKFIAMATATGTQIDRLRISGDVKMPAPGTPTGVGEAAAMPARIIGTPPA